MTVTQERDRLKAGMKDLAQYCPYPGGKEYAAHVLNYDEPLKLSAPIRDTGVPL
jgi:hypothetical protein